MRKLRKKCILALNIEPVELNWPHALKHAFNTLFAYSVIFKRNHPIL